MMIVTIVLITICDDMVIGIYVIGVIMRCKLLFSLRISFPSHKKRDCLPLIILLSFFFPSVCLFLFCNCLFYLSCSQFEKETIWKPCSSETWPTEVGLSLLKDLLWLDDSVYFLIIDVLLLHKSDWGIFYAFFLQHHWFRGFSTLLIA